MIQLRDLTKTYGNIHAVRGLTFQIPKGQVVGFLGPNGAGKTTTLKMLTGYLPATSGSAIIAGIDIADSLVSVREHVGYLPENNPLYEEMMVVDYLRFISDMRGVEKAKRKKNTLAAVERCGLVNVLSKDIGSLSKGYRQRVGLAQALLHDPELLLLDEPTSGLDPNQIVEIRQLIKELGQEKTILMSTHILSEAQTTCSRVLIINDGKLVADDAPEKLISQYGGALHIVLCPKNGTPLSQSNVEAQLFNVSGVTRVEPVAVKSNNELAFTVCFEHQDPRKNLFEQAVSQNWVILEMRPKEASLEETFRRLTME